MSDLVWIPINLRSNPEIRGEYRVTKGKDPWVIVRYRDVEEPVHIGQSHHFHQGRRGLRFAMMTSTSFTADRLRAFWHAGSFARSTIRATAGPAPSRDLVLAIARTVATAASRRSCASIPDSMCPAASSAGKETARTILSVGTIRGAVIVSSPGEIASPAARVRLPMHDSIPGHRVRPDPPLNKLSTVAIYYIVRKLN